MRQNLLLNTTTYSTFTEKGETYEDGIMVLLGNTSAPCITLNQTHSNHIHILTNPPSHSQEIPDTDAIISTCSNVAITVRTADCLPILFYHPKGIIGAIHAGRKGTEDHIFKHTLHQLKTQFSVTDSLTIWFGPHICNNCYEINKETHLHYNLFHQNLDQLRSEFTETQFTLINEHRCTLEDNKHCYSYRRDKTTLRHYSSIVLN